MALARGDLRIFPFLLQALTGGSERQRQGGKLLVKLRLEMTLSSVSCRTPELKWRWWHSKNLLSQLLHNLKRSPAWLLFLHNKSASQDLVCSCLSDSAENVLLAGFRGPHVWPGRSQYWSPYLIFILSWSPLFSTFSTSYASDLISCPYDYITFYLK